MTSGAKKSALRTVSGRSVRVRPVPEREEREQQRRAREQVHGDRIRLEAPEQLARRLPHLGAVRRLHERGRLAPNPRVIALLEGRDERVERGILGEPPGERWNTLAP